MNIKKLYIILITAVLSNLYGYSQIGDTISVYFNNDRCYVDSSTKDIQIEIASCNIFISASASDSPLFVELRGASDDGSIFINGNRPTNVLLNGLKLSSRTSGIICLKGKNDNKIIINDNTENELSDFADGDQKACIYSKSSLSIGGSGFLKVNGNHKHAIATKKAIYINKDAGEINLTCIADGGKGMNANDSITIDGGTISILAKGNAVIEEENGIVDTTKASALKADSSIVINSGILKLICTGSGSKCINTDGTITIGSTCEDYDLPIITCENTGKTFGEEPKDEIDTQSKPKGIKADGAIIVNKGCIKLHTTCDNAEGMESKSSITLNNCEIWAECYDDCINATGPIVVNNSFIHCVSNCNDAIDTNTHDIVTPAFTLNGGIVLAFSAGGPFEEGIDVNRSPIYINNGYLFAIGGQQGNVEPKVKGEHTAAYLRGVDTAKDKYYSLIVDNNPVMTLRMPCNPTGKYVLLSANGMLKKSSCRIEESLSAPSTHAKIDNCFWINPSTATATNSYSWLQEAMYTKKDVFPLLETSITNTDTKKQEKYYTITGIKQNTISKKGIVIKAFSDNNVTTNKKIVVNE